MPTVSASTHFPGYELLSELGRGNARVVKARHLATGDLVAIKQFAFSADPDTLHRFQRESEIMTRIAHPNVVKVREIHLDAALPYLVMEFVEGGDLRSLLRTQGQLDVTATIRLGLQMAEAFRAIHPLHIIHRDIKPENILYRRLASGELHFLLTDFGIAKIRADESTRTRTGQSLMTYEYASPEQFDNPRQVSAATDYYSLGVVLFECLTGRVPFTLRDDTGLAAFMSQVLTAAPPEPMLAPGLYLPPSLGELLRGMLVKRVADRMQNVDEVELLLGQANVEQLKANRSAQQPQTHVGPVGLPATITQPFDLSSAPSPRRANTEEFDYEPSEESARVSPWWWVALLLVGGLLTYYLLNRNPAQPARMPAAAADTTAQAAPDTAFSEEKTSVETDTIPKEEIAPSTNIEPLEQVPADSAANLEITPDSTATVPLDSMP
ncbi:serine/threonine protein kinase [Spirosoma taeanense]|uniref:Serine/threonine protein kinase n=1 Tax=Spirosoma taeanense TaxID=2735870 RepID=A0A6M5Y7I6_9BACT|nr:serine/threonine-protein kinase [Spirosoma taeanense]QJW90327.1 serine/threonine protein kinase [Spirosoma taeanense]